MSEGLRSILTGTAGLTVAALAALFLTLSRAGVVGSATALRSAVRIALVAVLLQAGHFAEEVATGFYQRFPERLGLAAWSLRFFVSFNFAWLAVWLLSAWGLAARRRVALFPLWFLAVASIANGLAHPALSLLAGGYFPGLFTSPLVGIAGVALVRQLALVTKEPKPD